MKETENDHCILKHEVYMIRNKYGSSFKELNPFQWYIKEAHSS